MAGARHRAAAPTRPRGAGSSGQGRARPDPAPHPTPAMKRFLTAAVLAPLALLALFYLPGPWFFALVAILLGGAAFEFIGIVRPQAPHAPLKALLVLVPLAALAVS